MKFDYLGFDYVVGSVIAFDIGNYVEIGVIEKIWKEGENVLCTICEPSGRRRGRTLNYDIEHDKIRPVPTSEARYLDIKAWLQRQG